MKFAKSLLLLTTLSALALAEEIIEPKPKIQARRTEAECKRGFDLLHSYYAEEVEKNPRCTYSEEYGKEHGYEGDYTMSIKNRKYFCKHCLAQYLRLGNPMVNDCGEYAPEQTVYDLYFLSNVNTLLCFKDQLSDKYCESVIEELYQHENNKPLVNWQESTLCNECPFLYHTLFKEREDFYKALTRDSIPDSFINKLLPLRDIEPDCFKEFEHLKKKAIQEKMEKMKEEEEKKKQNGEDKKNIKNLDDIMEDLKKEENKEEEEKEKKVEEEKKKASEAGEL